MPAVEARHLVKVFYASGKTKEFVKAVDDVSFEVPHGKIFTLLGPSGCGKTTVLRCVAGLEVPDSGEIAIGETLVYSSEKKTFVPPEKRRIGMVFQTYAIWPHLTVFDNVAYPLQIVHAPRDEVKRSVAKALELVQLQGLEERPATKLSGGQQQRVALARALVYEPQVLLLDEPLSNLDAKLRDLMRRELKHLLPDLKITSVYVTHDQVEALALSDVVAVMNRGRIIEIGEPSQIYERPRTRFVADFIGKANLIDGTVTGKEGRLLLVDTPLGEVACETQLSVDTGRKVAVCVRPEFVEVTPRKEVVEAKNTFEGEIESFLFTGEISDAWILSNDVRIRVNLRPGIGVREGSSIYFSMDPVHCHVLTE